ncbi:unnamed protein product [Pieris macdunnoughi]|uniref:Uncharacterized protein n=2 Tax=Pieris TaxID=7115 RepID=A0A9P0TFP3_PIEBR|nr:unnamed protein product [Pieris macdunnoughi]CAH4028336.1 unnamed protein product [Pieris brassicae]
MSNIVITNDVKNDEVMKSEVTVKQEVEDRPQRETRLTSIIDHLRYQNMSRGYGSERLKQQIQSRTAMIPSALFVDLRFIGSESNCAGAPDACLLSRP